MRAPAKLMKILKAKTISSGTGGEVARQTKKLRSLRSIYLGVTPVMLSMALARLSVSAS